LVQQKDRERFISNVTKDRKGIPVDDLRENLIKAAASHAVQDDDEESKSVTDLLIELVADAELFHDADCRGYATIEVNGHFETYPIRSRNFRLWLRGRLWDEHGKNAYSEAMQVGVESVEAMSIFDGSEIPVFVRLAEHNGSIWIDLADENWQAVRITADGWQVYQDKIPVKFIRPKGLKALPEPKRGGSIDQLRKFLNVRGDDGDSGDYVLMVSWIMSCLQPSGPYPILCVTGEQGSAKSSACRILRNLIDPNTAALRSLPQSERDLAITAGNSWIIAFDNLSRMPNWLSDALCRISTGGGFGTRQLHTDQDEILFDAMRPIVTNGITDVVTRADLLDRSLNVTFAAIPESKRQAESKLWSEFDRARPRILGALLDAVAVGLRNYARVNLDRLPRMADFARWITACEPALGWPVGTFMSAYESNRSTANAAAIEANIIGPILISFLEYRQQWEGTYKQLLTELESITDEKTTRQQSWPRSARKLSGLLRRITPNLRASGIVVSELGHTEKGSTVRLDKGGNIPSEPSGIQGKKLDDNTLYPDEVADDVQNHQKSSGRKSLPDKNSDEPDDPDDVSLSESKTDNLNSDEREIWEAQVKACLANKDSYGELSRQEAEELAWECIRMIRSKNNA
jgi:hypothetical protein